MARREEGWLPADRSPACMKAPSVDGRRVLFSAHIELSEAEFQLVCKRIAAGESVNGVLLTDVAIDCYGLDEFSVIGPKAFYEHFARVTREWFEKAARVTNPKAKS